MELLLVYPIFATLRSEIFLRGEGWIQDGLEGMIKYPVHFSRRGHKCL